MKRRILFCCAAVSLLVLSTANARIGRRWPSEKKIVPDPVTGVPLTFLTSTENGRRSKIYPTHRQWTADGKRVIFQSSRIVSLGDALDWWFGYWDCDKYAIHGEEWKGFATYVTAAFRHMGKANIAYWDGHVDQMTVTELKDHLEMWLYAQP
ncbi:MAG: hypothetical protein DRP66_06375 [Planctomycetota bacterium]|nr:MAG: hypothetical protein DRP66_06375 [Planctomycetota bacterium]